MFFFLFIFLHCLVITELAMVDPDAKTTGQKIVAFLAANFATGPGATGWIMTAALGD